MKQCKYLRKIIWMCLMHQYIYSFYQKIIILIEYKKQKLTQNDFEIFTIKKHTN